MITYIIEVTDGLYSLILRSGSGIEIHHDVHYLRERQQRFTSIDRRVVFEDDTI
jgi:hypothetical protein